MTLYLLDGQLLLRDGQLANDEACCDCGGNCCGEVFRLRVRDVVGGMEAGPSSCPGWTFELNEFTIENAEILNHTHDFELDGDCALIDDSVYLGEITWSVVQTMVTTGLGPVGFPAGTYHLHAASVGQVYSELFGGLPGLRIEWTEQPGSTTYNGSCNAFNSSAPNGRARILLSDFDACTASSRVQNRNFVSFDPWTMDWLIDPP